MPSHARLEIRPCIERIDARGHCVTSGPGIADTDAHFFGVYRVDAEGGADHVADFPTCAEAKAYAASGGNVSNTRHALRRERHAQVCSS